MAERISVIEMIYGFGIEGVGGGIGRFATSLCQAFDRQRFDVTLVGLWTRGESFEEQRITRLNEQGLRAYAAAAWDNDHPYQSFWRSLSAIRSDVSRQPADIVHSHSEFTDPAALVLKAGSRVPAAVRTVHYGFRVEWRKRPLRRLLLTNLLYPLMFDREIGVSQTIASSLSQRWLSRRLGRSGRCIYNAIDLERFSRVRIDVAAKKASLGIPADAPLVGSVGRLTEQKGYTYLIDAVPHVLAELPEAYFLIAGDGELEAALKEQARRLQVSSRVIFTGPRPDIEELLACMDLFASSSLWEGLPTVILESMAARIPVAATDIPGTTELVRNEETGWLAPPGDGAALARVIVKALRSEQARHDVVCKASEMVKKFSIEAVARQHEELYEALVGRRKR